LGQTVPVPIRVPIPVPLPPNECVSFAQEKHRCALTACDDGRAGEGASSGSNRAAARNALRIACETIRTISNSGCCMCNIPLTEVDVVIFIMGKKMVPVPTASVNI
jgi:hypothetical protein